MLRRPRSRAAAFAADGTVVGDPTEVALLLAARDAGLDHVAECARLPRVAELPFDPERKCMTTFHRLPDKGWRSITKGAAEVIIAASGSELHGGAATALDAPRLRRIVEQMAAGGLRVLAIGVRHWPAVPATIEPSVVESELQFIGLRRLRR